MKKVLFLIPVAAMMLAGCGDDAVAEFTENTAVDMAVKQSQVTEFDIWKEGDAANSHKYTYTAGSGWQATPCAINSENVDLTANYYARHTPKATRSDIPDILVAGPLKITESSIPLVFTHAFSQLHVVVATDAKDLIPVDGAQVEMTLLSKYTLSDKNALTVDSQTADYTFIPGGVYTVLPQKHELAEARITLTNGNTYKAGIAGLDLKADKAMTLVFTLGISEIGVTVGEGTWGTTVTEGVQATADGIAGDLDLDGLPGPGTLLISTGSHSATYVWDGDVLSCDDPIYWEHLDNTESHMFTLKYTPDAAGTPEKDILSGTATNVEWGGIIAFGTLTHDNTSFAVKLVAGTGYTAAELAAGVIVVEGLTPAQYTIANETFYVFKPLATVSDNVKITLTVGMVKYTLKVNSVFTELLSGKQYRLEATVNKSGLGLTVGNIEDWKPVTGSGGFEY